VLPRHANDGRQKHEARVAGRGGRVVGDEKRIHDQRAVAAPDVRTSQPLNVALDGVEKVLAESALLREAPQKLAVEVRRIRTLATRGIAGQCWTAIALGGIARL